MSRSDGILQQNFPDFFWPNRRRKQMVANEDREETLNAYFICLQLYPKIFIFEEKRFVPVRGCWKEKERKREREKDDFAIVWIKRISSARLYLTALILLLLLLLLKHPHSLHTNAMAKASAWIKRGHVCARREREREMRWSYDPTLERKEREGGGSGLSKGRGEREWVNASDVLRWCVFVVFVVYPNWRETHNGKKGGVPHRDRTFGVQISLWNFGKHSALASTMATNCIEICWFGSLCSHLYGLVRAPE